MTPIKAKRHLSTDRKWFKYSGVDMAIYLKKNLADLSAHTLHCECDKHRETG